MNIKEYIQSLQMNEDNRINKDKPKDNFNYDKLDDIRNNMLSSASKNIESKKNKPGIIGSIKDGILNTLQDISVADIRRDPALQGYWESVKTTKEKEIEKDLEVKQALKFLQEAEEAKELRKHREDQLGFQKDQLSEMGRFHNMQEKHWNADNAIRMKDIESRRGQLTAPEMKELLAQKKQEEMSEKWQELQKTNPGAVYYDSIKGTELSTAIKEQKEAMKGLAEEKDLVREVQDMINIVKENPGLISSNYDNLLRTKEGELPSVSRMFKSNKKLTNIDLFSKGINSIKRVMIGSMPGLRPNIFMEKLVSSSVAGVGKTDEAITKNLQGILNSSKNRLAIKKQLQKDRSDRVYNPFSIDALANDAFDEVPYNPDNTDDVPKRTDGSGGLDVMNSEGVLMQIPANTPKEIVDAIMMKSKSGVR